MGKTKIKTIGEEINSVIAIPTLSREKQSQSQKEGIASSPASPDPRNDKVKKEKKSKRAQKKVVAKIRGKKYQEAKAKVESSTKYSLLEAVKLAQSTSYSKFPGTLEAHFNTTAKNLRGLVTLPHLAGKKLTILAFGTDADKSGADIVGTDETIEEINKGKINFDVVVTTPAWMPKLTKVAKILGPRGLMPSPKNGTITEKLSKAISELQTGKVEYKTEKEAKVIHLPVGKVNQNPEEIAANIKVLYSTIGKSKISKITLSPTMGPGVKVDLSSI